jgi:hypothetical protein
MSARHSGVGGRREEPVGGAADRIPVEGTGGGEMPSDWHDLTDLTGEKPFVVTGVRLADGRITISGEFELPLLARLRNEDQVFVGEFVRCHGSIKHMEKAFGISYPTVKNRLNRITEQLRLIHVEIETPTEPGDDVLDRLERGEISADEAAARLRG